MQEQVDAQMATIAEPVQWWMNWMMLIFAASIVFVWKHKEARWTLGALVLSMPTAMAVFALWGTVHLFGIVHWLLWAPLAAYLVQRWRHSGEEKFATWGPFRVWVSALLATIFVSLAFDARDIVLVLNGTKGHLKDAMHQQEAGSISS
jgi:hypothetical protein